MIKEAGSAIEAKAKKLKEELLKAEAEAKSRPKPSTAASMSGKSSGQTFEMSAEMKELEANMNKLMQEFNKESDMAEDDPDLKKLEGASNNLDQMFSKLEDGQKKTDNMLMSFERNFGLRIRKMCDDSDEENEQDVDVIDDGEDEYIKDGIKFKDRIKKDWLKLRGDFK